jgi:tetratricopeptide (TPR) repeat protein
MQINSASTTLHKLASVLFGLIITMFATSLRAGSFLVEEGRPNAEIIIAEKPRRSTRLAAADLRTYVEKISGAKLPIATEPSEDVPVHIFVGSSTHAEELGITAEGLKHGAYRIVSGENWLALIGDDTNFVPKEPWARNNGDRVSGKLQREWEVASGLSFGVPNGGMYKNRERLPGNIGKPDGAVAEKGETLEIWGYDERGSFNAVCGFLRSLGVRWYLPGELGEVVPDMPTIALPKIDKTVEPDFEVRQFNVRFGTANDDTMFWAMRLGIRHPYGLMIAHGMHEMTHTETVLREHPDWFALYGGRRDTEPGKRLHHLCYSNEELFHATVQWARAQFDVYDYQSVSIMPPDAYISICQCDLCEGKDVPEMGSRGKLSNHVWDFVNRVAKDVGKTHPDKNIACCAYGANTDPPTNIEKLEANVQVIIVGGRRPRNSLPEQREPIRKLREGWMAKTASPLMIFENYPSTGRGTYLPAFVARTIGESINATKGVSRGEDIWLSFGRDFDTKDIGFNHFQVYFTARMYWGGKERDVVAMLDEYCRLFYGPAGSQMKTFFEYCEANYQAMEKDKEKVDTALAMFSASKAKADPNSVYAKRLGIIDKFLDALRSKAEQLGQKRGPVSKLRTVWDPKEPVVIDGKLDDQYWRECPTASSGRLRELQTGRQPIFGTKIMTGWDRAGGNLYFAIRCEERPGEQLNIATTENEDQSMWYGDAIEIELKTDSHSYYQIAVNPSGALIDLDRGEDKSAWYRWQSQAEVATHVAEDHWTVEIRIPVTDDENDPLNQVVGRKPSASLPWYFNICRQRIRKNGSEHSAFSPTGTKTFHEPMKFAYLYDGRSHQFEADPTVTDYLIASGKAADLMRGRKYEEALIAFVGLAEDGNATDFQKSDALQNAAACARSVKDFHRADELAGQIPLEAVAKTVRMENSLGKRETDVLIEQFGGEDFGQWPFWQIGAGAFARGRAYYAAKIGDKADADLQMALEFTSDSRTRMSILRTTGFCRERVLEDDDAALETYHEIAAQTRNTGSAEYYYGIQGAARILTRRGKFDEALEVLSLVEAEKLAGSWSGSMLLARGQTLAAAGRKDEALQAFRGVLASKPALDAHRNAAEAAIKQLENE